MLLPIYLASADLAIAA